MGQKMCPNFADLLKLSNSQGKTPSHSLKIILIFYLTKKVIFVKIPLPFQVGKLE